MSVFVRCRRDRGQDMLLIIKYFTELIIKNMYLCVGQAFHMQINPVAVSKLHQPAIEVSAVSLTAGKFVGILHIENMAEAGYPVFILNKRQRICHHVHNVVVLKNIPRRVIIGS